MSQRTNPSNINTLNANNYRLSIKSFPDVEYAAVRANVPGISFGQAMVDNRFTVIPLTGDKIDFDFLDVQFVVYEDISNWLKLFDWMVALAFTRSHDQYTGFKRLEELGLQQEYSDIQLHILTNAKNYTGVQVDFYNAFPVSVSSIDFDSQITDETPIIASARFQYQVMEVSTPEKRNAGIDITIPE